MLPVSLDCPFLNVLPAFSNFIYAELTINHSVISVDLQLKKKGSKVV
jgi:hypothetical protein